MQFPIESVRVQFPALGMRHQGREVVFFDGPAGSQTPRRVIDAVVRYYETSNANHGGLFATSRASDEQLTQAHAAVADLVGADDPACVAFGANMTTLAFALGRALARTWRAGDEVLVTLLDHDANVSPWVLAARDAGAVVRHVEIDPADCTLDLDDLRTKLTSRTRLVAVGAASNAVGTVNPIRRIVELSHAVGALVFVDAVHYVPHALADVAAWNCDFLACSAYKFFGPHVGVLWGRRDLLEALGAYKVRPASESLPERWMTGTQNHEGIVGAAAAVEYLADLGRMHASQASSRREALAVAFRAIGQHERSLAARFLARLCELPQFRVLGISDPARLAERVPTFGLLHSRHSPRELCQLLADQGIFAWHGNFYALPLTEALGLEPEGMLRVGFLHYNTVAEVDRLADALAAIE